MQGSRGREMGGRDNTFDKRENFKLGTIILATLGKKKVIFS